MAGTEKAPSHGSGRGLGGIGANLRVFLRRSEILELSESLEIPLESHSRLALMGLGGGRFCSGAEVLTNTILPPPDPLLNRVQTTDAI